MHRGGVLTREGNEGNEGRLLESQLDKPDIKSPSRRVKGACQSSQGRPVSRLSIARVGWTASERRTYGAPGAWGAHRPPGFCSDELTRPIAQGEHKKDEQGLWLKEASSALKRNAFFLGKAMVRPDRSSTAARRAAKTGSHRTAARRSADPGRGRPRRRAALCHGAAGGAPHLVAGAAALL